MKCSMTELSNKEVINITTGEKLGYADDIIFETETSKLVSFVIYGRPRFFGIFGRDDDCIVNCCDIEVIGSDTILISSHHAKLSKESTDADKTL